jgi:hypothetical protein
MSDNKNYSNDLTNNEVNSFHSITENNVDKMIQELSNQTYGYTVDDHTIVHIIKDSAFIK